MQSRRHCLRQVKPEPIRCCRCATSSYFRTRSRPSSSDARSRSSRSRRRCGSTPSSCSPPRRTRPTTIRQQRRSTRLARLRACCSWLKLPDGTVKVLVEGAQRAKVVKYTDCSEYYEAEAVALGDTMGECVEAKALARSVTNEFESYVKLNKRVPPEVVGVVQKIEDYAKLADTVASHLALKIPDQQAILETTAVTERLGKLVGLIDSEISIVHGDKRIRSRVERQIDNDQPEDFFNR